VYSGSQRQLADELLRFLPFIRFLFVCLFVCVRENCFLKKSCRVIHFWFANWWEKSDHLFRQSLPKIFWREHNEISSFLFSFFMQFYFERNFCRGLKCRALKWIFMIHRWMEIFWNFIGRDFTLNLPPFQMEFEIEWLALFYSLSISPFLKSNNYFLVNIQLPVWRRCLICKHICFGCHKKVLRNSPSLFVLAEFYCVRLR